MQQRIIPRVLRIFPQPIHDGGADVHLRIAEERAHRSAREHVGDVVVRASVLAALDALPRIERARIAVGFRLVQRARQRLHAVFQAVPRHLRHTRQIEIQHEHLCIPENRALIRLPGQPARRHRQRRPMPRRDAHQVVHRIIDRELRALVAFNRHPRFLPERRPRRPLFFAQSIIRRGIFCRFNGGCFRFVAVAGGVHRGDLIQLPRLTRPKRDLRRSNAAVRDFTVRAAAPERRADALMIIRFAGQGDDAVRFCQRQRLIMRTVDVPDVFVHAERNGDDAVMCRRDGHALCEQMHPLHRAEPFLPDGDFARIRLERAFAGEHTIGNIEREAVRCKPIGIFRQRHAFHGDIQRIRGIQRLFPALPLLVVDTREVDGGHLLYARFANRPANAHIPIARQKAVAVIRVLCRVKPRSLNHRIHPCIPPHVQNFPPCGIHGGKFAAALRFSCYGLQVFGCGNFGSAQFASWERPHPPTAAGTFPLGESEVG